MNKELMVMCGNRLNLYHQKFTVGGLENGLRQAFLVGMPSLVAHDSHRPIAWSYCLGLYFEPGHTRLTGYINLPETNSELETITRVYLRFLVDRVKKATDPNIETLKANLTTLLNGTETALDPRCTALVGEKLAVKRFPDIFGLRDEKHGLVPITALSPIAPGIYERDGLLLFAHQYFRRSLSRLNTLNEPFLAALQELSKEKGETVRVRLDEDMVGLASTLHEHLELQYWWGPKFSPDLKNIPDGITRHEATERDRAINGISRTEFGWHSINDLRTFECEELCDIPSRGVSSDHFGCRYIHSHLDSERKVPVHIDGAIRMYSSEKMLQRLESDLKKAGRDTEYTKLWRVDGALPIEKWKELVTHYYRDNRLPGEYFDGVDKNVVLPPVTPKAEHSVVDRLCVNMQKGQDVRVSISYHRINDEFPIGRSFQTFDTITRDSTLHFIEGDSIELVKAIRRSGGNVILPKNVLWVLFKEKILNFPLIMHKGENCLELMKGTQAALLELCKAWIKRGDDRLVAYTLGISYKEQEVWCSVAGQVEDVTRWLEGKEAEFPKTEDELEQWCEKINTRLTDGRPPADDMPPLDRLLKITGVLHFDRTFLDPEDFKFDTDDKGLLCSISKTIAPEIMDSLEHGELSTAIAMSVESNCSKCKGVYRDCLCSKFFDEGVVQVIHDADPLGVFYTKRPA